MYVVKPGINNPCIFIIIEVSDAPKEAPAAKKFTSYNPEYKSDEQKKEEV